MITEDAHYWAAPHRNNWRNKIHPSYSPPQEQVAFIETHPSVKLWMNFPCGLYNDEPVVSRGKFYSSLDMFNQDVAGKSIALYGYIVKPTGGYQVIYAVI